MFPEQSFTVRRVRWDEAAEQLSQVRKAVFIVEQNVPEDLEWDSQDAECLHVLAESAAGEPIGTGRLLPDAHIGRMAVLRHWRGKGVGRTLMQALIALAQEQGFTSVLLNAQTHATGFYLRLGFAIIGEEFLEAGIPHCSMRRLLPTRPSR